MCNAYPVNNQNLVNKIFPSCNECQKLKGYDSVILSFISSRLNFLLFRYPIDKNIPNTEQGVLSDVEHS